MFDACEKDDAASLTESIVSDVFTALSVMLLSAVSTRNVISLVALYDLGYGEMKQLRMSRFSL
jgi:hypothetical protein